MRLPVLGSIAQLHSAAAIQRWRRLPCFRWTVRVLPTVHLRFNRWGYSAQQQAVRCGDQLGWRLAPREEGDSLKLARGIAGQKPVCAASERMAVPMPLAKTMGATADVYSTLGSLSTKF